MSQAEKDAIDAAEAAAADTAMRTEAKSPYTNLTARGWMFRALADVIRDEINILRDKHSLPARTLAQLKTAIEARIDNGDVD